MNLRAIYPLAAAALLLPALSCAAADALTSLHPEEAYPDNAPPLLSQGPYSDFNKRVQEKLRQLGFDAGPANGDFGSKTQAALAQFQLSRDLPASGQLDDRTLAELGVEREVQASAGTEPGGEASAGGSAGASADPGGPSN